MGSECSSGLRWNSWQGIASGPRWRARPERVPGAARLTLQVSENPIDDSGIGDDGDNLHLCAADTEKRIHLENLLDEAGPGCPASLNELRGGMGRCARACRRRGLLLARGFRRTCAVGERSVIPHAMPTAIGDVGGDGVDPVERIEEANGRTGAGIGRCGDLKHAVVGPSDAIGCKRRARHVTREPLKLPGIFRGERLSGENRKPGMDP